MCIESFDWLADCQRLSRSADVSDEVQVSHDKLKNKQTHTNYNLEQDMKLIHTLQM